MTTTIALRQQQVLLRRTHSIFFQVRSFSNQDVIGSGPVSTAYQRHIEKGKIRHDQDQLRLSARLDKLFHDLKETDAKVMQAEKLSVDLFPTDYQLMNYKKSRLELIPSQLKAWFLRSTQPKPPRGIYIYGHVGVGKSYLMDLFHHTSRESKATQRRRLRRSHFHEFMLDVHDRIHKHRQQFPKQDALPAVALSLARESRVFCFDEFQVTDIADAMILKRLFHMLFEAGVVVVATSNRSPDTLYEGGLNRALFLPFIDTLKEHLDCIPMVGETDYRRDNETTNDESVPNRPSFFFPNNTPASQQSLNEIFASGGGEPRLEEIPVMMGRTLTVPRANDSCCWFDFMELCHRPLGAADYLAVCERFPCVIIDNVPQLDASVLNEARRFVTLIDAAYESRTRLVLASQVPLENLLVDFQATFETQDGDEEIAGDAIQLEEKKQLEEETMFVKNQGGSSSSAATTFVRNSDGTEVEWSATGRIGVSLAQLSAVRDVSFSFRRAESRLVEMNRITWGRSPS